MGKADITSVNKKNLKEAKLIVLNLSSQEESWDILLMILTHIFALQGMISIHHNSKYFISKQSCGQAAGTTHVKSLYAVIPKYGETGMSLAKRKKKSS